MTTAGPRAVVDEEVDGAPTLELPVVPASAVPDDGASPAGVVPPGTPPMVLLPPSRWSTWVAGAGAAASAAAARFDQVAADTAVAARRARATAVRQAGAAGLATWHGFVALLAGAATLVFTILTGVFRHARRLLPLAVTVGMVVVVVRAVPWGQFADAADGVVRHVQGWSTTTTTTTSTTTTTEDPYRYDDRVPCDEWPANSGEFGDAYDYCDDPTTTDDPYRYDDTSSAGGQRVETVRPS